MTIWPLIEAGEFTTIADVGMSADDLELTSGRLSSWMGKQVDKLPEAARTPAKYGYLAKDTALYQGLLRSVQYGDFVAKAILYDHLTGKKKLTKKEALGRITEEFVNYDRSPGRTRGALENIGLLWFFNFKLRITKVALSILRNNPVFALATFALPTPAGIGLTSEDNVFGKLFSGNLGRTIGPGMGFRAPTLNPWVALFG